MKHNNTEWSTRHELSYIRGLVAGTWFIEMVPPDPVRLLTNYIKSAKARAKNGTFGDVDPERVIAEATNMMEALRNADR